MNEIWKSLKHPKIVDGYMLSSHGRIKNSIDDNIKPYEASYHSSNGYDYEKFVLKEEYRNISTVQLFPIDDLIAMTFIPVPDGLKGKRVKVNHIDGCNRNNHIDNLEWVEDVEEWRMITYPCIKPKTYEVSNWGRIRNIPTNHIYKNIVDTRYGYHFVALHNNDNISKHYNVHRLVAWEFNSKHRDIDLDVNHINGVKNNNEYKNVEWVTRQRNIRHAIDTGLNPMLGENNPGNKISERVVHKICQLLKKHNGSIQSTLDELIRSGVNNVSRWNIERIKYKKEWTWISDGYFKSNTFPKCIYGESNIRSKLTNNIVHEICQSLVDNNGSIIKTLNVIVPKYRDAVKITRSDIEHIKYKKNWSHISDEYFSKNSFQNSKSS